MPVPLLYDVGLVDGDLPSRSSHIRGFDVIVQRVDRKLRTFLGEYIADASVGLPFREWIAQKPPLVDTIGAIVRRAIETVPGVIRVIDWTGSLDTGTRTLSYSGTIHTSDGDVTISLAPFGVVRSANRNPSLRLVIVPSAIGVFM